MRHYKISNNGYIISIGTGNGGTEITEEEYNSIMNAINNAPEPTEGIGYSLKEDLTWESYEVEPIDPEEEELTEDEVLSILMGEE